VVVVVAEASVDFMLHRIISRGSIQTSGRPFFGICPNLRLVSRG
jgi:hypothetical protein